MKKKLLSLVLTGAMVASTSVSAFAQDKLINNVDTDAPETNVTITGKVLDEQGKEPAGNFNVTVPTTASFTVSKKSGVISVPMTITNNGDQSIDVYAVKFADTTPGQEEEITVIKQSELNGKKRSFVNLNLKGNLKTVYLRSEELDNNSTGIYQEAALNTKATTDEQLKLAVIKSRESDDLKIEGSAGNSEEQIDESLSNKFTLTLKIKKSEKKQD